MLASSQETEETEPIETIMGIELEINEKGIIAKVDEVEILERE